MTPDTPSAQGRAKTADALGVGPDTPAAPTTEARCPHCRGAVRPDAPWCTQCWTDLRPAPPAQVATVEPVPVAPPGPGPEQGRGQEQGPGPGWPCVGCGTANPVERDACAACGTAFLASLRSAEAPVLVLPVVGDLARLGRGQQYALAGAAVLAVALLTLLLGLLTG